MKKLLTLLAAVALTVGSLSARDKIYRSADVLPQAAHTTLQQAFPKADVNRIKVDSELIGGKDYEVVLSDGSEIEFNDKGEWKEVDCGHRAVPRQFVLPQIATYVKTNYKGAKIVKVEKSRSDYDVELSTGVDLKFDRSGAFLRIDD